MVVVPSLTPDDYNLALKLALKRIVVVPSLTPDDYNSAQQKSFQAFVVVPSLTPDDYNYPALKPLPALCWLEFEGNFFVLITAPTAGH